MHLIASLAASTASLAASITANTSDAGTKGKRKINTLKSVESLSLFTPQSVKLKLVKVLHKHI